MPGDDLGQGGLTGAGGPVEDERAEAVGLEHAAEEFVLAKEVLLADELVDRARAHAGGQRPGTAAVLVADVGKKVADGRSRERFRRPPPHCSRRSSARARTVAGDHLALPRTGRRPTRGP